MTVAVVGAGAVGARAARQLLSTDGLDELLVAEPDAERRHAVVGALGAAAARAVELDDLVSELGRSSDPSVAVLTAPRRTTVDLARRLVERRVSVVSTSDDVDDVRDLLALDEQARAKGCHVVVGAGFSPGLTCVLASHAGGWFDQIDEIHVAKVGTGGPACARSHHRALASTALDVRDGEWVRRRGGSGRELCWFPDPIGPADCYRAGLPDALLLAAAFPEASRITARMAANRRDRITSHVPMLRRPHPDGGLGAVRVEVRGRQGNVVGVQVLGAMDRPAVAAGTVAALAAAAVIDGTLGRPGAGGLAELVSPVAFLGALASRGVKAAVFEGSLAGA